MALINRLARKGTATLVNGALIFKYLRHARKVNRLAQLTMLAEPNLNSYRLSSCPICNSDDYHPLIRLPLGYPRLRAESLFFFDHTATDLAAIGAAKDLLDQTLGFVLSVPWNFCNGCKNGSLALALPPGHLKLYYEETYRRMTPLQPNRRATKQLIGQFLGRMLKPASRVLEISASDSFSAECVASQGHEVIVCEPTGQYHHKLDALPGLDLISDLSNLPDESLDAIYLHHSFDHITSPLELARNLNPLLRPRGLLFIQVPDLSLEISWCDRGRYRSFYSLFNRPDIYRENIDYDFWSMKNTYPSFGVLLDKHVSAFTPEGLRYVMEESGFEVEQMLQSTAEKVTYDPEQYAWPVEVSTGNMPNGISLIARKCP